MRFVICVLVCALAFDAVASLSAKKESISDFAIADLGRGYYKIRTISVDTQVVKGTMYHVHAKVGYQIPGGIKQKYDCNMKVWERPSGFKTVEESNCN